MDPFRGRAPRHLATVRQVNNGSLRRIAYADAKAYEAGTA
jgi:hypothetical protein